MTPPTKRKGHRCWDGRFETKAPPTNKMKERLKDVGRKETVTDSRDGETKVRSPLPHTIPGWGGTNRVVWQNFCTKGVSVMECLSSFPVVPPG